MTGGSQVTRMAVELVTSVVRFLTPDDGAEIAIKF